MPYASVPKFRRSILMLALCAGASGVSLSASAQSKLPKCSEENISKQCFGVVTAPDGNRYIGEMKGGKANGKGALIFTDGKKYGGQFRDGAPNGKGTITHPDGESYTGNFKDGKKSGQGKLVSVKQGPDGVINLDERLIGLCATSSPTLTAPARRLSLASCCSSW